MKQLLLADDDDELIELYDTFLSRKYKTCVAKTVNAAIAFIDQKVPFDAAVIDLNFSDGSGMDGIHIAERFQLSCPNAPIILVTGEADDVKRRDRKSQIKNLSILEKPFFADDLFQILKRLGISP